MTSFADLGLSAPILRAVRAENYTTPTPIQAKAIPHLLAGRDLLGCAQTGTGKTAAFALPILHRLSSDVRPAGPKACRALVLTPTRELAAQIRDSFGSYGRFLKLRSAVVFGGVGQGPQVRVLARGVDVLIATPGRLLDLMGQGLVRLDRLEVFVLDEADRMLDMGFIHDVRRVIAALPRRRQSLFFSATMLPEVVRLAGSILSDPVKVEAHPVASTAELVEQRVMFVDKADKRNLLGRVLQDGAVGRALVFTRTKHGADRVVRQLVRDGVPAEAIHGDKSQTARTRALEQLPHRRRPRAGGDRHRGAGHRRRGHHARDQLRPAERPRELRAPDRAHRAGRAERRRDLVLRCRGARIPARHRGADQDAHPGGRGPSTPSGCERADTPAKAPAAHSGATRVPDTAAPTHQGHPAPWRRASSGEGEPRACRFSSAITTSTMPCAS